MEQLGGKACERGRLRTRVVHAAILDQLVGHKGFKESAKPVRGKCGDGSGRWGKEAGEQFVNMGARLD